MVDQEAKPPFAYTPGDAARNLFADSRFFAADPWGARGKLLEYQQQSLTPEEILTEIAQAPLEQFASLVGGAEGEHTVVKNWVENQERNVRLLLGRSAQSYISLIENDLLLADLDLQPIGEEVRVFKIERVKLLQRFKAQLTARGASTSRAMRR